MAEIVKDNLSNMNKGEAEEFMKDLKVLMQKVVKKSHDMGFIAGAYFAFVPYTIVTFLLYVAFGEQLFESLAKFGIIVLLSSWAIAFFMRGILYYMLYRIEKIPDNYLTKEG